MREFRLPDLGEGLQEAEIVEWHVSVGDEVAAGERLVTVETDKALVEVTSPRAGRIAALVGSPGDRMRVGAVLVEFETAAEDRGTVVGELPVSRPPAGTSARPAVATPSTAPASTEPAPIQRAAPAVRELARRLNVDLRRVSPTGPAGSIISADVERAAAAEPAAGDERQPLSGVRLAMAKNMERARRAITPATVMDDADVDAWFDAEADVTVRLLRAVATGCGAEPNLNAWFDASGPSLKVHSSVDVAVAVQTEEGLFAPVLRNVAKRSGEELRAELDELASAVRSRKVQARDLREATITLSNFGAFGGRYAQLVVVPPQVAILGAGRVGPRAVATQTRIERRNTMPLSLTFNHQALTGAEAARFLAVVIEDLERPD